MFGLRFGFGFNKDIYNPLINYDWSTKNINGLRYLTDKGKSPKYDAQLYFGQGVYFNGVDQGIGSKTFSELGVANSNTFSVCITTSNVTVGTIWNTGYTSATAGASLLLISGKLVLNSNSNENTNLEVEYTSGNVIVTYNNKTWSIYVNGVLKASRLFTYTTQQLILNTSSFFSTGSYHLSSQYCNGVLKDAYMFNRVLSQSEITQSYEQPEAFYAMAQADTTCVLNMPMCENDGYVRNMKTYSEGDNFSGVTIGSQTKGTGNSITQNNNTFNITNVVSTGQVYYPIVRFTPDVFNSDLYYQEIEVKCVTGTLKVGAIEGNPSTTINEVLTAGQSRVYTKVNGFANLGGQKGVIYLDGLNYPNFTAEVTLRNLRKITNGIQPIQNYTTACRTSAQNLSYGLQTCKFNRDSLGVIQSASQFFECKGLGYANTGYVFPSNTNWSIEFIGKFKTSTLEQSHGTAYASLYNRVVLGTTSSGSLFARCGGNLVTFVDTNQFESINNLSVTYENSTKTFKLYRNGIFVVSHINTSFSGSTSSFYIGSQGAGIFPVIGNAKLFKVHDKALTQAEITKNYNSYVAKGLLA